MAMKANYLVRETGSNLRRNITLTLASIVTVAVSLALFGIGRGVDVARPSSDPTDGEQTQQYERERAGPGARGMPSGKD